MAFLQQRLAHWQEDLFDRSNGALGSNWTTENVFASAGGINSSIVPEVFSNGIRNAAVPTNDRNYQSSAVYLEQFAHDNIRIEAPCLNANTGLYGGLIIRASADRQYYIVGAATSSGAVIQTRIAGTFSAVRSQVSGNFFTTNDTFVFLADGNTYQVKRIRSGTETLVVGWNDSSSDYPRAVDRTRIGYFGHSDRNIFGTQGWGLRFSQIVGKNT